MKTMWLLPLIIALTACGSGSTASSSSSLTARDTVFGDDIKALDKARQVQDTLMKDKANTDAAIENAQSSAAE